MSTKDLLKEYNDLAARIDRKPLKAWKESKAKLEARIEAMRTDLELEALDSKPEDASGDDPDVVTLADLARELGRNPKVIRAKLRRLYNGDNAELPTPIGDRWTFARDAREAVLELIGS